MAMKITNRVLAQLAGVSPATVSKVFSSSPEISPETAERVRRIAVQYGWTPPKYRQQSGSRRQVSVLVPELLSVYYGKIATCAAEALRGWGAEPAISIVGFAESAQHDTIRHLIEDGRSNGILSVHAWTFKEKSEIPLLELEPLGNLGVESLHDLVTAQETDSGIGKIFAYLLSLGHRKIAFISEKFTQSKLQVYRALVKENGLSANTGYEFISDKRFEEVGYEGASFFLRRARRDKNYCFPTAMICAYDEVAFGCIRALRGAGLKVPEDVSVVGINDIATSAYAYVPLTTVRTFSEEKIRVAARMLMEKIEDPTLTVRRKIEIPCELMIRDSTAPPRPDLRKTMEGESL